MEVTVSSSEIITHRTDQTRLIVIKVSLLKAMLHETICNDNFYGNNDVATIRNNVATMLQRCVVLKIVVANSPV